MKRKLIVFVVFLTSIFVAGCMPQKMYHYGNYSQTLYDFEKEQNEEALMNHKQELENIVSKSAEKNLAVPPGIYAELGYFYLKANNSQEAIRLFQLESRLYPESKHLMDRLIQSAKAKENDESDASGSSTLNNTVSE